MVLKPPGAAQTPKLTDFHSNHETPVPQTPIRQPPSLGGVIAHAGGGLRVPGERRCGRSRGSFKPPGKLGKEGSRSLMMRHIGTYMSAADGLGFSRLSFNDLTQNVPFWGVWAAPGGFRTIQKGGGLRPPPFWMVLKPPGAAQTPKMTDFHSNH
jgi:hypothetical protein